MNKFRVGDILRINDKDAAEKEIPTGTLFEVLKAYPDVVDLGYYPFRKFPSQDVDINGVYHWRFTLMERPLNEQEKNEQFLSALRGNERLLEI